MASEAGEGARFGPDGRTLQQVGWGAQGLVQAPASWSGGCWAPGGLASYEVVAEPRRESMGVAQARLGQAGTACSLDQPDGSPDPGRGYYSNACANPPEHPQLGVTAHHQRRLRTFPQRA
jgi:hypothetical protein